MTAPPTVVFKIEPEVMVEIARLVVVACDDVEFCAVKFWRVVEPRTRRLPVVVAPPEMVRPEIAVPPPIVEEAVAPMPWLKTMSVEVALAAEVQATVGVNGKIAVSDEEEILLLKSVQSVLER
jgi:hypothetical protein